MKGSGGYASHQRMLWYTCSKAVMGTRVFQRDNEVWWPPRSRYASLYSGGDGDVIARLDITKARMS